MKNARQSGWRPMARAAWQPAEDVLRGGAYEWVPITDVALVGDSITTQNSSGLSQFQARGYASAWRMLCGSKFNFVSSAGQFYFAQGTKTSSELIALGFMAGALASAADTIVCAWGMNDCVQNQVSQLLANYRALIEGARLVGKQVIVLFVTPIPLAVGGNEAGVYSARVAAANAALPALVAEYDNAVAINHQTQLEAVPGSGDGVGNGAKMLLPFDLHPSAGGALDLGRGIRDAITALGFSYGFDPLAGGTIITPGYPWSTGSGMPTNYLMDAPGSGSNGTITRFTDADGTWVRMPMVKGGSTGNWQMWNFQNNIGGSPASQITDTITRFRVFAGSIGVPALTQYTDAGTQAALDQQAPDTGVLTSADGIMVLRTPRITNTGSITIAYPAANFLPIGGDATVDVSIEVARKF